MHELWTNEVLPSTTLRQLYCSWLSGAEANRLKIRTFG